MQRARNSGAISRKTALDRARVARAATDGTGFACVGTVTGPVFHLSFPVRDLDASIAFYQNVLGCTLGRREPVWADIALFGAQVTLQHVPGDVLDPMPRSRHFGATLGWSEWEALIARLTQFVEAPRIDYAGEPREQAKAMIVDPSGNFIELKAYRESETVLGVLGAAG